MRDAAREAHLEELGRGHAERIAAIHEQHEAAVRRQKKLLRELGVPDPSPEEVTERALRGEYLP